MAARYDLLTDAVQTVFAINCEVLETEVKVEGIYLEPLIQSPTIELRGEDRTVTIELPNTLLNRPRSMYAKEVIFPIFGE